MTTATYTKTLMTQLINDVFNPVSGSEPNRAQIKNVLEKVLETVYNMEGGISPASYVSGRWYASCAGSTATTSYSATGAGTIAFVAPLYVGRRVTITKLGVLVSSNAACTAMKIGIYSTPDLKAGTLLASKEVTGISTSISADTEVSVTLDSALTLEPGWYFIAGLPNGAIAGLLAGNPIVQTQAMGADTLDANWGRRVELQGLTYIGGFPSSFSNISRSSGSSVWPVFFMKVQ